MHKSSKRNTFGMFLTTLRLIVGLTIMSYFIAGTATAAVTSTTGVAFTPTETQVFTGTVVTFTANDAGPFTATINWGDGSAPSAGIITPVGGGFAVSGSHTYAEDGSYTVSITITDTADNTTVTPTTTATVGEQTASQTSFAFSAVEGTQFSGTVAHFDDPGSPDPASAFTSTIDWGDGTTSAGTIVLVSPGSYDIHGTHTYADEGSYLVTVTSFETIEPAFNLSTSNTATVAEADVLSGSMNLTNATLGFPVLVTIATFTDTNIHNVPGDFTATIDWGDGASTVGTVSGGSGTFKVSGSHTYAVTGSFTVSVTLNDDPPGTATATTSGLVAVTLPPATVPTLSQWNLIALSVLMLLAAVGVLRRRFGERGKSETGGRVKL